MGQYGLMTVTEVRMSPDLRHAKVFISIFGDEAKKAKSLAMLEKHKSEVRSAMGQVVRLRYTPFISFVLDETVDYAMDLEKIFKKIHDERGEQEQESSSAS
jgi:ribosome-binding factor A